jgi:hypothetical protein
VTDLLDDLAAVMLVGVLNILLGARVRAGRQDGAFLGNVYATSLGLRAALAILLDLFASNSTFAATFWGDSGTYDAAGYALARHWHGDAQGTTLAEALSGYGFVYIDGAIYYVFGRNQLLVQLLNCTVGALTVPVVHAIAVRLFDPAVGRWAALFMAFFPQMVFWSAGMYKDPTVLLCIALCMYSVIRLKEAFSPTVVLLFVGSALSLLTLRFYVFYFFVAAAVGTFVIGGRGGLGGRLAPLTVLLLALGAGFSVGVRQLESQAAPS